MERLFRQISMRIGYLSYFNSKDVRAWSGSIYFIRRELEKKGVEIVPIDNLGSGLDEIYKVKSLFYKATGKNHHRIRERSIMQRAAEKAARLIEKQRPDVLLSLGSLELSMLKCDLPATFWTDATFRQLVNYYPEYSDLSPTTLREGEFLEEQSINGASRMFFASEWAAGSAINYYSADESKVKVLPFGANLYNPPTEEEVADFIARKDFDAIELLFVGVAFERKGGNTALEIARKIKQKGRKVRLHIIGCNPEINEGNDFVKIYGFLNKARPDDMNTIEELYRKAHFFVMPSLAECYGIVFCEANAYGLPVVGANNGGMPTIIKHNTNGFLFDYSNYEQSLEEIADKLIEIGENRKVYEEAANKSRNEYKMRLNWEVSVGELISELNKISK